MAQLDCGSCGYVCKSYAEAIASGSEKNLTLCGPGGKETKQVIKLLLKDGSEADRANKQVATLNGNAPANGHAADGHAATARTTPAFNRQNPFSASLVEISKLNKENSAKDVRHVVIDLSGSGLEYEVGDALGVYPGNCGSLAAAIVGRLSADPGTRVRTPSGSERPLIDALREDYCLRDAGDELLELLAVRIDDAQAKETLEQMLADGTPAGFDVLDALDLASRATVTATEVQELKAYAAEGLLTRLDTAFSRDGDEKVYVQDRMRQNSVELWRWLSKGGHFYVCGDASRMADDVERALLEIIMHQGVMDTAAAKAYLENLTAAGRYVRDVY